MKEKDIQREFGRKNKITGVFELKLCKGTSLPFSSVAPHQEKALLDASGAIGCYHKLSDFSMDQKPWDCQRIANTDAYIVICFYTPRKNKMLYYIPIHDWVLMREASGRKSATEDMCYDDAKFILDLNNKK